jgi:ribose 5-phosphate isomerase B
MEVHMRIVIGGDHAGVPLKTELARRLAGAGHDVRDVGAVDERPVDFPDMTAALCELVTTGEADRGVLVCGTGIGASIAANKIRGIRAALAHDVYSAHQSVEHDDANVLCLGAWIVGRELAWEITTAFLAARWDATPDVVRRVAKLSVLEEGG